MGINHAQHRVGRDRGVDRVAAVPQDLSPYLRSEVMRGRDDPFSPHELSDYAVSSWGPLTNVIGAL
jgi:hypothetical protein